MKKINYFGLSLIASSVITNTAMADGLEEVIVTSSLIDASANEISNPIHIMNGKTISDDASQSLGSIIDGLTGVSSSDFGAGVGQPIIRGLGGSRVKILNNGKVVRDVAALGPDHLNQIDLGHLEQIEIVRGPSSLLYANGAVGGIVNIVDNTIAKQDITDAKFEIGAGYEDGNTGNTGTASYQGNVNGINVTSSIQYSNLDVYAIPEHALHEDEHNEDHEDPTSLENSDFANFSAKIGFSKVTDWGYVGLSVADSNTTYGVPFHGEHADEHGHGDEHGEHGDEHGEHGDEHGEHGDEHGEHGDEHGEHNDEHGEHGDEHGEHGDEHGDEHGEHGDEHGEHEGERTFIRVNSKTVTFENLYNFKGDLINSAEYSIRDTDYEHIEGHGDEHGTIFSNQSTELAVKLDMGNEEKGQKIALNIAEEEIFIDGHEQYLKLTKSDELTLGYYLSNQLDFAHIDFGIRVDQIDRKSEAGNYDDNLFSYSFAASKDLSDNLDVSLGLSSVEKAPSAMELFVDGDHMVTQLHEVGDDSLTAEKANNIDLTFNTAASGFDINLSLFKNSISNFIYLNDTGVTAPESLLKLNEANYLQQDATFEGYELQISRSINLANGSLVASLGRDSVDAQFDQGGYIPRTVPTRNLVGLNYSGNDGLNWLVSLKDIQGQSKVAANEEATDGYQWLDVKLSKGFKLSNTEVLNVSVFAKNLLNKVARNHSSFVKEEVPLPGKNIGIKAKLSF